MPPKKRRKKDGVDDVERPCGDHGAGPSHTEQSKKRQRDPKGASSTDPKQSKRGNRKPAGGRTSVIKTSLKKFLVAPDITQSIIDEAVLYVSRVSRAASMAMNLVLLDLLRKNNGILPFHVDFKDDTMFYQLFTVVTGRRTTKKLIAKSNPLIKEVMRIMTEHAELFPKIQPKEFDGYILTEASQQYETAFINHHVDRIDSRIVKYVKTRIGRDVWKRLCSAKRAYKVINYILKPGAEYPGHSLALPFRSWIDEMRSKYQAYKSARRGPFETTGSLKMLVELTYFVGCQLEQWQTNNSTSDDEEKSTETTANEPTPDGHMRSFSIAPICQIKRHFIVITRTTLETFFLHRAKGTITDAIAERMTPGRKGRLKLRKLKEDDDVASYCSTLWHSVFKEEAFKHRSLRKGWIFDDRMLTDGVSLCVAFRNRNQPACTKDRNSKKNACDCYDCSRATWNDAWSSERLLANDPGKINIFFMVEKDPRGNVKTHVFRNKQYYLEGGVYRATKITQKHVKRSAAVFDQVAATCRKTVSWEHQLAYWKVCAANDAIMWLRLCTRVRAKLAFESYGKKTSSIDRFLVSVRKYRKTVPAVGYGAGGQGAFNPAGCIAAPTSKAYQRCKRMFSQTFLVQEPFTSQYCPYCDCKLHDKTQANFVFPSGRVGTKVFRSVKRCSSPSCVERATKHPLVAVRKIAQECGMYEMSRDKAGSLNIRSCAENVVHGLPRPQHLTFEYNNRLQ